MQNKSITSTPSFDSVPLPTLASGCQFCQALIQSFDRLYRAVPSWNGEGLIALRLCICIRLDHKQILGSLVAGPSWISGHLMLSDKSCALCSAGKFRVLGTFGGLSHARCTSPADQQGDVLAVWWIPYPLVLLNHLSQYLSMVSDGIRRGLGVWVAGHREPARLAPGITVSP